MEHVRMLTIAMLSYGILAWLRPRLALGILLFLIPFGHLVRFTAIGVPFTFPEAAVYVLAIAIGLRTTVYRLQLPTPPRPPSPREGEKNNFPTSLREGGRGGVGDLTPHASRLTPCFRDPWVVLPLLWILVATIAAAGSLAGARAWGIWKAYFLAPVVLFWIVRYMFQRTTVPANDGSGMTNDQLPMTKQIPMPNDQNLLPLTSYLLLPIAASAFLVAAIAIAQRWWPIGVPYPWDQPGQFRTTSVFGYPNAVGLSLAPLVPLFVGVALHILLSLRGGGGARRELLHVEPYDAGEAMPRNEAAEHRVWRSSPGHNRTYTGIAASGRWPSALLAMTVGLSAVAFLAVLAIILAKSTGALVALAVAMLLFAFLFLRWARTHPPPSVQRTITEIYDRGKGRWSRRSDRWAIVAVGAWVAASLLLTLWLPFQPEQPKWGPPIVQKLTFQQWSGSVRLAQYRETWQFLRDHPIRGAGLAGYQQAIAPYHEDSRVEIFLYPHHLLLAVWVELGLFGLLIFLAILYKFFRTIFSPPPDGRGSERGWGFRFGIVAAMLVILIHGLVDVPYFKNDLAAVFWVIVAITSRQIYRRFA